MESKATDKGQNVSPEQLPEETSFEYEKDSGVSNTTTYTNQELKFLEAKTKKEGAKKFLFQVLSGLGILMGIAVAFLGIVWAFNVSSIAKPVGSLETAVENIENNINRIWNKIDTNSSDIQEIDKRLIKIESSND